MGRMRDRRFANAPRAWSDDRVVSLESLEQRMLLSGSAGPAAQDYASVDWFGHELTAMRNEWVLTFDERLSADRLQTAATYLAGQLGLSIDSIESLARGKNALLRATGVVQESVVRSLVNGLDWLRGFEPNRVSQTNRVPNDPFYSQQWAHENIGQTIPGSGGGTLDADSNTTGAWDLTFGSQSAIVAVIDTGVQIDHPDLAANIYRNPGEIAGNNIDDDGNGFVDDVTGWDFGEFDNNPDDVYGHGTQVAGVIGAVGNNNLGVAGVAWNVLIIPMKIANQFGGLSTAAIIGAHDYLTMMRERGVDIVASNNSYGSFAPGFYDDFNDGIIAESDAIQAFIDSGGVFVASAGNEGSDNDETARYPSTYDIPGLISVAATDNNDALATFSNYGAQTVDLGAPGVDILTTAIDDGYSYASGTSFSAPMVAGAVALMKSLRPQASGEELRQVLIASAKPLPTLQNKVQSGGRLDIAEALRIIGLDGPVVTSIDPGPVVGQVNSQGQPVRTATITFNRDLNPSALGTAFVTLVGAGANGTFGNGDDFSVPVSGVTALDARTVRIDFNLASFLQQRLPLGVYRLTLLPGGFIDTDGNFLNGDSTSGLNETYDFTVASATSGLETNDDLSDAEPINFTATGTTTLSGLRIGDGLRGNLDVDLFKVSIPRGGLIRAQVNAQSRAGGSTLDSYLRLFDALGNQIASNDQFNGSDSLIDFFVTTGGFYYVGVSGFGNATYNPAVAGSGQSQSLGVYDLVLRVDLVQDDRVTVSDDFSSDPERIPPQGTQGTLSKSLTVSDARAIRDVNVRLTLSHTFDGDLRISLISPQGTTIILSDKRGGDGNDFTATLFDDEATLGISAGTAPFSRAGGYRPDQALSTIDGQSAAGTWTLLIQDTVALNTGELISWALDFTLQSDIFGPFESNDTLATARDLVTGGTGSAQAQALIGDGGFGNLDRDLYRLVVSEGATLGTSVSSSSSLNAALRLFDENGSQLILSSPEGSKNASITNFVFARGGTYYLGVSEASNTAYDPKVTPSGVVALTTGNYTLSVAITAGVSDTGRALDGDDLTAGASADGTFVTGSGLDRRGLRYNGTEFLFQADSGIATHFFGASAGGFNFRNDGSGGGDTLPVSLTDQSDALNRRIVAAGTFRGMRVERATNFSIDGQFVAIDVTLTNTTTGLISNVSWMEAFNPQQGLNFLQNTTANTVNDAEGRLLTASFSNNLFPQGLTIGLAAPESDTRATATFFSPSREIRDPSQILAIGAVDPNGTASDQVMALAYNLGSIDAGASTTMRYFVFFGDAPSEVQDLYDQVNDGTGAGHLSASPTASAVETLLVDAGDPNTTAPTLPYRLYYPEGFANSKTSTFVPILNPNSQAARVVVIVRYETGARDEVIKDFTVQPNSRGGVTLTNPELFAAGTQSVRGRTPYAVEIRSSLPVAANFSHYDLFQLADGRAALGESFTNRVSSEWTFAGVTKGNATRDYLLYMNSEDHTVKVTTTFYSADGTGVYSLTQNLGAFRRGGIDIKNVTVTDEDGNSVGLPAGVYGVSVVAQGDIVAVLSHYDRGGGTAYGLAGTPGLGATEGATPEGQIGLNATEEVVGVLNANSSAATVLFSFLFQNGTSYRTNLTVPARTRGSLSVIDLPNFPVGQPYSVFFESDVPISLSLPTHVFGDEFGSSFSDKAYTLWGFGEGFRPKKDGTVVEYLRLFNPAQSEVVVEITMLFDGGLGQETFRRTIDARSVQEYNIHDFVTGARRNQKTFYGITVKAATPIVAYMGHFDGFFPGGFGSLGTPLGTSVDVG